MSDQVVRVIVIQKTLINMLRSFAKLKKFLKRFFSTFSLFVEYCPGKYYIVIFSQQRTFWNGAVKKFLRDIQEGSTEAAEVGW
ncbi:hypothetical protein HID58_011972 [Brassica napus]|uniref:Uncharacterized protein n=1 Tax=Brassica napus TaxID=3708 RepID=A0ABQ8E2D5_BRANA|nr:hypothetical protein HID58_011972 [Brassica napus]